jgi:hypothetical protein
VAALAHVVVTLVVVRPAGRGGYDAGSPPAHTSSSRFQMSASRHW